MSNDTIDITTPNGHKVVIRSYTTRGDDKQANAILSKGMTVTATQGGEPQVSFTLESQQAADSKYVELLVQSIDGEDSNMPARLDELRSEDYDAIDAEVKRLTTVPKAKSKS